MDPWPSLPVDAWQPTRDTLHRWTQVVGKVAMACTPAVNHWWHVTLHVDARGLRTPLLPSPDGAFDMTFDFARHELGIRRVDGTSCAVALTPRSVADFYAEVMARLAELGVEPDIVPRPVEVEDATPFPDDHDHASYDPDAAVRFWRTLVDVHRVMTAFRGRFTGKVSPVHFFWGAFDLAVTRFSGRTAPLHPGGAPNCPDWVMHEAYSHEVSSAGYWPGFEGDGVFYSYAYPEPEGFRAAPPGPAGARYDEALREFVLPVSAVRAAPDPDAALDEFLQRTYDAAADLAGWDREALERR